MRMIIEDTGRMGAGFALSIHKETLMSYSVSVGGTLAPCELRQLVVSNS